MLAIALLIIAGLLYRFKCRQIAIRTTRKECFFKYFFEIVQRTGSILVNIFFFCSGTKFFVFQISKFDLIEFIIFFSDSHFIYLIVQQRDVTICILYFLLS